MKKNFFAHWRGNFLTGLAVVLPTVVTIAVVIWLFGTVSNVTDKVLFFLSKKITHQNGNPSAPMLWYWSLIALALAVVLIALIGRLARNYIGKRLIASVDTAMLRVPLLNKFYGTIKQVNEAFTSGNKTAFKTVVLIEFPRPGIYSVGFITSEEHAEIQAKTKEKVVCVFVPTTPNPTSGFLMLVPEDKVTRLDMSVAEGIKYIISLGSIAPEYEPPDVGKVKSLKR